MKEFPDISKFAQEFGGNKTRWRLENGAKNYRDRIKFIFANVSNEFSILHTGLADIMGRIP